MINTFKTYWSTFQKPGETGPTVIKQYYGAIQSMAINGNTAYYAAGYSEGNSATSKINLLSPQAKTSIMKQDSGAGMTVDFSATDGNLVYWAGADPFGDTTGVNGVFATKVSDDTEVTFTNGTAETLFWGKRYNSLINFYNTGKTGNPSGLAVQKDGNFLFVSHKTMNQIDVLDKTTGAFVTSLIITLPRALSIDGNDDLWVIYETNSVKKFTVAGNGVISATTISISGLIEPLAIAHSFDNVTLAIADGGTSQQVKAYNNNDGSALWTLGRAGGYATDPTVTDDKFYFNDTFSDFKNGTTFIAFQTNGSFWVGDQGNKRAQHYSASRVFIDRIMQLSANYSCVVSRSDPTRVFSSYLEFKIDYSKPLLPNNGSWTLVKNWKRGLNSSVYSTNDASTLTNLTTMNNGRTYATIMWHSDTDPSYYPYYPALFEVPASGNLRFTGIKFGPFDSFKIDVDGSIVRMARPRDGTQGKVGTTGQWTREELTGFDIDNNPLWAPPISIATIPTVAIDDPAFTDDVGIPSLTGSDMVVTFNFGVTNSGYHLGAVKFGSNKYLWRTALSTHINYKGPYPDDGRYDLGNDVKLAGSEAFALDKSIIWSYHGEFWKGGQTNMWSHVYDNGLLVSSFGTNRWESKVNFGPDAAPGMAGNALQSSIVKVGSDIYLYHPDEGDHAALHRWKISNLASINEQIVPITGTSVEVLPGLDLMAGLSFDAELVDGTNSWSRYPATNRKLREWTSTADVWEVFTNRMSYKKDKIDIYMGLSGFGRDYYVARALPTLASATTNWKITGNLSMPNNQSSDFGGRTGAFVDVVDDQGKIISRIYKEYIYGGLSPTWINANGEKLAESTWDGYFKYDNYQQVFEINVNSSGVMVNYSGYSTARTALFDPTANWRKPKYLKFVFIAHPNGYNEVLDVDSLRFIEN